MALFAAITLALASAISAAAAAPPSPAPLPVALASRRGCSASLRVAASRLPASTALVGLRNAKEVVLEHFPAAAAAAAAAATTAAAAAADFEVEVALEMRGADVFLYALDLATASASLLGALPLPACDDAAQLLPPPSRTAAAAGPAVGMLYEAWQAYAANASATVKAMGGTPLSVEAVMRSNGALVLSDIWDKYNVSDLTQAFYWQEEPLLGFYCIYRKRWNESEGVLPDCVNITGTVTQQAEWFAQSGVDFVTADGTNLCTPSPFADAIQTRPMEVLLEEFSALRAAGMTTPAVAAWQRAVTGCTLHSQILDIYNNMTFNPLIYRDPATGKMVMFVPDDPDPSIVAEIESNGGRNNVLVQEMWALFVNTSAPGRWAFESPCSIELPGGGYGFTTSVVGRGRGASGCGQLETEGSALGSALAVSPSYQESYGSVPFSAANKYEGLIFKRQFGTVFDNAARKLERGVPRASALVDNIYLSSWNEYLSQPQPNPWAGSAFSYSMGIPWDAAGRKSLWVDTWGQSISRDIEPSVHGGSLNFDIMSSCLRVVRLLSHVLTSPGAAAALSARNVARMFGARAGGRASDTACAVAGEMCCAFDEATDGYAAVSAVARKDGTDALVTLDPAEVAQLVGTGAWAETCNGYGGPTDFCVDNSAAFLNSAKAVQGPFALHSGGCGLPGGDPVLPGRNPIVRCFDAQAQRHFIAGAAACPGTAALQSAVGCAAAQRSSNTPRELRACTASAASGGRRYHSLDAPCEPGDADDGGALGYVH